MPPYRKSGSTVHKICSNILIPSPGPNPITGGLLQGQSVLQWGPREVRWVMMSRGKCCLPWLLRAVGIWGQRLEKEAKTHPLCSAEFWASPFQAKLERLKNYAVMSDGGMSREGGIQEAVLYWVRPSSPVLTTLSSCGDRSTPYI